MGIAYWAQRTQRTMHPLNCIMAMVYGLQSMRGHLKVVQDFQGRMYPRPVARGGGGGGGGRGVPPGPLTIVIGDREATESNSGHVPNVQ